jgi:hypothetical protein
LPCLGCGWLRAVRPAAVGLLACLPQCPCVARLLARSVSGFRSVGSLAGLVCAVRAGYPLLAGFSLAVVARRWLVLGSPVGVFPVPTAPLTPRLRVALRASRSPLPVFLL